MQTNLIKENQAIKEIKDYLKFYFISQEFTYLSPQKILETIPIALDGDKSKTKSEAKTQNARIFENRKKTSAALITAQPKPAIIKQNKPSIPTETPSAVKDFLQKAVNLQEAGSLDSLRLRIQDCQKCNLCLGRKNIVYGQGNQKAQILFIGEGPGMQEDQQGLPFVGKAGQLLNQMLLSIAIARESIYITNLVKCRPPNNRNPEKEEIKTCSEILDKQIELINPKMIVLLGSVAMHRFFSEVGGIKKNHGELFSYSFKKKEIPTLVTFHPAFLLRFPENLSLAWNDFRKIRQAVLNYCER